MWPPQPWTSTFDDLFPHAEKQQHMPPVTVRTPEALSLPLYWGPYAELRGEAFALKPDYSATLSDAVYCPLNNVVMNREGVIVKESRSGGRWSEYPRPYLRRKRGYVPGVSALLRGPDDAHFHVLMDWLPRLLSLWAPPYDELGEIKLLVSGELTDIQRRLLDRVAPPNARIVYLPGDRLYDVERLVFSTFKSRLGYLPERYARTLRDKLLPARPSRRDKRILISRQNAPKRRIRNFAALEEALTPHGFSPVAPERLSLKEEIELFYDAEFVVGAHGSGLTNVLFSERTAVLELFATSRMAPHFYLMCKCLGHDYEYVPGEGDSLFPDEYDVDVGKVVALVDAVLAREADPTWT